jgi:hypothetical protein
LINPIIYNAFEVIMARRKENIEDYGLLDILYDINISDEEKNIAFNEVAKKYREKGELITKKLQAIPGDGEKSKEFIDLLHEDSKLSEDLAYLRGVLSKTTGNSRRTVRLNLWISKETDAHLESLMFIYGIRNRGEFVSKLIQEKGEGLLELDSYSSVYYARMSGRDIKTEIENYHKDRNDKKDNE